MNKQSSLIIGILALLLLVPAINVSVFAASDDSGNSDKGGSNDNGDQGSNDNGGTNDNSDNNANSGTDDTARENEVHDDGSSTNTKTGPSLAEQHGGIDDTLQDNADDVKGDVMRDGTRIKDGKVVGHEKVTCGVNSQAPGCGPNSNPHDLPKTHNNDND